MTDPTELPPFTPRNVAKFVVKSTISVTVASRTRRAIADHSAFETTDTPVIVGAAVVGWYVSEKVRPVTDKAVDKTFDFASAKRDALRARRAEKSQKTETE